MTAAPRLASALVRPGTRVRLKTGGVVWTIAAVERDFSDFGRSRVRLTQRDGPPRMMTAANIMDRYEVAR